VTASHVQPEKYASGIPTLAAEEAKHLRRARRLAPAARRTYLADLGARLAAHANHVERRRTCFDCGRVIDAVDSICDTCGRAIPAPPPSTIAAAQVARLREVAQTLRPCARDDAPAGADLDALWERTHATLIELADGATPPDRNWHRWYRRLLRLLWPG